MIDEPVPVDDGAYIVKRVHEASKFAKKGEEYLIEVYSQVIGVYFSWEGQSVVTDDKFKEGVSQIIEECKDNPYLKDELEKITEEAIIKRKKTKANISAMYS